MNHAFALLRSPRDPARKRPGKISVHPPQKGHAAERSNHRWDESLQALLPLGKWQLAKILSSTPQYVEGDVGQRTPTAHKIPEVDPAFIVQCHDLPVQNEVSPANSLPSCSAKLRKRVIVFSRFE